MANAARHILGLRAHTLGETEWSPDNFYSPGDVVSFGGHRWRATLPVARGHAPQGIGDGSTDDRQLLLDQLKEGWAAGLTGGMAGATYTVTTTAADAPGVIPGSLSYALKQAVPLWIVFDPAVFPLDAPAAINFTNNAEMGPNKTIDGRGAGVQLRKFPIELRTDRGSPIVTNRGLSTVNTIMAYVEFVDFPNGTSVVEFGGNNPFQRGGADLIYLHHLTVHDVADQMMSNSHHDNIVSRSSMDWCRFGPSPGPIMMSLTTQGGPKIFQVDAADVAADTVTNLDPQGNPTNHGLRPPFTFNSFRRADLSTHPYPAGLIPGNNYSVRNVGQAGQPAKTFTADSTTNTLTSAAHGYSNGDPVVLIGTTLPTALRNGYIYYVRAATTNTFQVSNSNGGGVKDFSSNGSGTMQVQKADLTKMQLTTSSSQNLWTAANITGQGTGWYIEEVEPLYYENGKGPQWGNHHDDDIQDGFVTFTVAANTVTTIYPHYLSNGDRVRFWAQASNLPTGVTQGDTYFVRDVTSTTFKISDTSGGAVRPISGGPSEQACTLTAASDIVTATGHGLAAGDMVTFYGGTLPSSLVAGTVYWVADPPDAALTADTFQVAQRKHDPVRDIGTGSTTLVKKPPLVQLLTGPTLASITKCDFRNMKIRSPKGTSTWFHLWNNRVYKWGDPDLGDGVGGCGNELADGVQALIENSIYRPYSSTGTEAHYWSAFTNPPEVIPTRGPSIYGINTDSGAIGPVNPVNWTGGGAAILRGNRFEDGATTRLAQSGATVIVNAPRLDWYDPPNGLPVPYDYDPISVTDPFILDTILDRGAGNVQPWELVT